MPFLNLVVLRVSDMERAGAFYGLLGLVFERHRHGEGPVHLSCEVEAVVFELYAGTPSAKVRVGFAVEDVEACVARVRAYGAPVLREATSSPWGLRAVVQDPDGHKVELTQIQGEQP